MKLSKIYLILFAPLLCLSFELAGQDAENPDYTRLFKGERSPYDTGIVIRLSEYRRVRSFVTAADSLVTGLTQETRKLYEVIFKSDSNSQAKDFVIATQAAALVRKDNTIAEVNQAYKDLEKAALRPRRRGLYFALGVVTTTLTLYTGSRLWPNR